MILRRAILRQGRQIISPPSSFQWRRCLSSEVESIEAAFSNSIQETRSLEALLNSHTTTNVPAASVANPEALVADNVAEDYEVYKAQKERIGHLGSDVSPHYKPHTLVTNPPKPSDVTLEFLLASQAHMGHATSVWNPANARYIFGVREGIHIISLDVIAAHLRRAARVVTEVARRGGLILFVGTREGQERCIVKAAELSGGCHLFEKWTPGSITNGQQILGRCRKKVVDENDKEVEGFEEQLENMAVLKPDLVVCINPLENYTLLHECGLNNIPTIGIIDTNANPSWVTYPIPANDDSLRCTQVIAGVLGRAGEEGKKRRLQAAKSGQMTFFPAKGLSMNSKNNQDKELEDDYDENEPSSAEASKRVTEGDVAQLNEEVGEAIYASTEELQSDLKAMEGVPDPEGGKPAPAADDKIDTQTQLVR